MRRARWLSLVCCCVACSTNNSTPDAGPRCIAPLALCTTAAGVACTDLSIDANNCGVCGTQCPAGQSCKAAHCGCPEQTPNSCGSGSAAFCTTFQTDPNNCGACGTVCAADQQCSAGHCVHGCPAGATACPAAAPTYCSNLQTDPANCGSCGHACPLAGEACISGACVCGFKQVSQSIIDSCAVKSDGAVTCWGLLNPGDQGQGSLGPWTLPGITGAAAVGVRRTAVCVLKGDGTIWCVGGNSNGQLGANLSTAVSVTTPVQVQIAQAPLDDGGVLPAQFLTGATALSTGGQDDSTDHFCAVVAGAVWCWGYNGNAQLGASSGSTPYAVAAVQAATPEGVSFKQVSTGSAHTCALSTTGDIYCWGLNNQLQGGSAAGGILTVPTQVGGISGAAHVSAGAYHTCAVKTDGTAWCWGDNNAGDLGIGVTGCGSRCTAPSGFQAAPQEVVTLEGEPLDDGGTGPGTPLSAVSEIAAGQIFTCARAGGQEWCWGSNDHGQIGQGDLADGGLEQIFFVATAVPGVTSAVSLGASHHSTCAVLADGTASCWGRNVKGQLGTGTGTDKHSPAAVAGCR